MNFKRSLPPDLYQLATCQYPDQIREPRAARQGEVRLNSKWSLSLDSSCGQLTRLAANDLLRFLDQTFGIGLRKGRASASPCIRVQLGMESRQGGADDLMAGGERYRLNTRPDGVHIDADNDQGAMRALFHLQWAMRNESAPILSLGKSDRESFWQMRITSPLLHELVDSPSDYLDYPSSYLLNMARYGYNATYLYIDLWDYISPSVEPLLARPGYRRRVDELNRLVDHFGKFGIQLLFHINTMVLPENHRLFKKYTRMRGAVSWQEGLRCLCGSSPRVLDLYRKGMKRLFTDVPDLAGVELIVGGECLIHCFSRPFPRTDGGTNCSHCHRLGPERAIPNVVNAFAEGVKSTNPSAHVLAWQYSGFVWGDNEMQARVINRFDKRVTVLETIEKDAWHAIQGTRSYIFDYSISYLGPSARFNRLKKAARQRGLRFFAKTEASQSIEMFVVPRLPVMFRWAERAAVMRKAGVDGVHTAWRFYGFCGQITDEIINHYAWEPRPDMGGLLRKIAERDYGVRAAGMVLSAWRTFSDAFGLFPYSGGITGFPYFRGPFYLGPAHPMVFDLTVAHRLDDAFFKSDPSLDEMGSATGSVDPIFFMDLTWTQPFGPRKVRNRLRRMEQQWHLGLNQLGKALRLIRGPHRDRLQFEFDLGVIIECTFCSALNLLDLQMARNQVTSQPCTLNQLKKTCQNAIGIVRRERENARLALEVSRRNPSFGFGSTYGRGFDADLIQKKIEHCDWQIEHGIPGFRDNYAFHIFADANLAAR